MNLPRPAVEMVDQALEATVVLSFSRIGFEVRRRLRPWQSLDDFDGSGRRIVVTGANSGLGYATACRLAALGARVHLLVRSNEKGERTVARIHAATGNQDATFDVADLADLSSIETFARRLLDDGEPVHGLVHNAGAMFDERTQTGDGIEKTVQVHVVGPFLLTGLLLPRLAETEGARVVTVTSGGMYAQQLEVDRLQSPDDYRPTTAYARAKRAQVVLTREWAHRFGDRGLHFHAMHPGWVDTPGVERSLPGFHRITGPILRDPEQGADTTVWLMLAPEVADSNGQLWLDRTPRGTHKVPWTRHDRQEEQRLWDEVVRLSGATPSLESDSSV